MSKNPYLSLLKRLGAEGFILPVAGGVAAVLYGSSRVTFDLDLIPPLESKELGRLYALLKDEGFRIRLPISLEEAADPEKLREWRVERNLIELTFIHESLPLEIGLLVGLADRYAEFVLRAQTVRLGEINVKVVSLGDLIMLKREAGRPKDHADLEYLETLIEK